MKRALLGMVTAAAVVGLSTAASANTITLQFEGGGTEVTVSSTSVVLVVEIYANFSNVGNGSDFVMTSLKASNSLTANKCKESAGSSIGAGATNSSWAPFTNGCGLGSPADGGLQGQLVRLIEQNRTAGAPAISGTILVGTVTYHVAALSTGFINAVQITGEGFVGNDAVTRAATSLGGVTVNVIPEPATVALLATGMLGLLGFSRRRKR